jgi:hypothetical protein
MAQIGSEDPTLAGFWLYWLSQVRTGVFWPDQLMLNHYVRTWLCPPGQNNQKGENDSASLNQGRTAHILSEQPGQTSHSRSATLDRILTVAVRVRVL